MESRFLYDPQLSHYQLSESHPFKPVRLELTRSLLRAYGALDPAQESDFPVLSEDTLARVHGRAFIDTVKALSRGESRPDQYAFGLGTGDNPVFPKMHEAILRVCSATVQAVDLVASGQARRALNLSGGLHHAHENRASGFCLYNDLVLGIDHAVRRHGLRVAYIDVDAHHGDGVQWLLYENPEVMTISLHETGRHLFPGTGHTHEIGKGEGRGLSVNVPLEPFTEDASFLAAFDLVVPRALERFNPDLIVLQAGADMHRYDPLADMMLSTRAMYESYQRVSSLANRFCGGKLVATGGGGYDPYRTVPRAWALLWAAMTEQDLNPAMPQAWREQWQAQSPVALPESLFDDTESWQPVPRRAQVEAKNVQTAERVLKTLEPIWDEVL